MRVAVDARDTRPPQRLIGADEVLRHPLLAPGFVKAPLCVVTLALRKAFQRQQIFRRAFEALLPQPGQVPLARLPDMADIRAVKDGLRAGRLHAPVKLPCAAALPVGARVLGDDEVQQGVVLLPHPQVQNLRGVVLRLDEQMPQPILLIVPLPDAQRGVEIPLSAVILAVQMDDRGRAGARSPFPAAAGERPPAGTAPGKAVCGKYYASSVYLRGMDASCLSRSCKV